MANSCKKLSANMLADYCAKAPVGGAKDEMYIIPFDDVDKALSTISPTNDMLITALIMLTGKKGYKVLGRNYSNEFQSELVKGTLLDMWKHTVNFRVLEDTVEAKQWVDSLVNTRVIVVIEKYTAAGNINNAFEVCGFDCGLEVSVATSNNSDGDTKGAFMLTLSSNEKSLEPKSTRNYLSTNYATTKAALEALLPA